MGEGRNQRDGRGGHFRAWPRRKTEALVVIRVGRRGAAVHEMRARLIDVGFGGAGLLLNEPLEAEAEVELVLHAPNRWDPLILPARVAWATREGRAGLAFRPRDDRDALAIFEMLGTQVF